MLGTLVFQGLYASPREVLPSALTGSRKC